VGKGVPSSSRGRVTTTAGFPQAQRYATPTTPRGDRWSCAATVDSSAEVMGSSTAPSSQSTKPALRAPRAVSSQRRDPQRHAESDNRPSRSPPDTILPSASRKELGVELMLVPLQLSSDGALVVAILIIGFIIWALWP
jgi:hypothetical protein